MKYIKIKSIIILSMLLMACGFKPINQKNINLIHIQNIKIIGEPRIAYTLKNNILLISNKNSENKYEIKIEIKKEKRNKIKDKAGKVVRYNTSITANLELTNLKDNKKIKKIFERSADHNTGSNYSETINNENSATKNIIDQLTNEISNFVTLTLRNK